MVDFAIKAFLWYKDPDAGKKGSDKIWGWVEVEGKLYNFWGRRADAADGARPGNAANARTVVRRDHHARWPCHRREHQPPVRA